MRETGLILLMILFTGIVLGQSFHELEADSQGIDANTTVNLQCTGSCPVNSWNLRYRMPEGSQILKINDSLGEITEYSYSDDVIDLKTNNGPRRDNETLKIQYRIDRPAEEIKNGLHSRKISFAGFQGRETSGEVKVENLLSGTLSNGFQASYSDSLRFRGRGPVQVNFNFGEGNETKYYSFFDGFIDSNSSYEIALGTTGYQQKYPIIPVVLYDEDYDDRGFEWSAGEYSSGLIHMRREDEDAMKAVLTHETVHALSSKPLKWDKTRTSYIEEGIAKHAESLMRKKLYREGESDRRPAQVFGEELDYREGNLRYKIPSKGNREELWQYYSENMSFMKEWNSQSQNREFGYAYGELIVKNHLYNNESISGIYSQVNPREEVESTERKWNLYSQEINLRPCDYNSRERFETCLDNINNHDYSLRLGKPSENQELEVDRIELPERRPQKSFAEWFKDGLQAFVDEVEEFWNSF